MIRMTLNQLATVLSAELLLPQGQELTQADAVQADAAQANSAQANAVQADAAQANSAQADAVQANAVQADATQADAVQADSAQADAVQADNAQAQSTELRGGDICIEQLATDTRKLTAGCLFVALIGERFDGHDFARAAQDGGAAALLVSRPLTGLSVPQLVVADTRQALATLAGWLRAQMPVRVVALTGSCGKTTVKEMVAGILGLCGKTLFTEDNLNNELGVPLTLLRLTPEHLFAVIELGANHPGEIARMVSLVRPYVALVNNVSAAHLAGFGSIEGVAQAKGEIFTALAPRGVAVINCESHDLDNWAKAIRGRKIWMFSPDGAHGDFHAARTHSDNRAGNTFFLHTPHGSIEVALPLEGRHNLLNALAAAALAMAVGAPLPAIKAGLERMRPLPGRLFPYMLTPDQLLIDDTYNANAASMQAAIQVLASKPGFRVLVAGDMAELGEGAAEYHRRAGEMARRAEIDCVLTVGTLSAEISEHSGVGEHFADKNALLARLRQLLASQPVLSVLVKGSRSAAMEQVVQALRGDPHASLAG